METLYENLFHEKFERVVCGKTQTVAHKVLYAIGRTLPRFLDQSQRRFVLESFYGPMRLMLLWNNWNQLSRMPLRVWLFQMSTTMFLSLKRTLVILQWLVFCMFALNHALDPRMLDQTGTITMKTAWNLLSFSLPTSLVARKFVWRTDNSNLSYANEVKRTSPKVARILADLSEFTYQIQRRSTSQMKVSDTLSRCVQAHQLKSLLDSDWSRWVIHGLVIWVIPESISFDTLRY